MAAVGQPAQNPASVHSDAPPSNIPEATSTDSSTRKKVIGLAIGSVIGLVILGGGIAFYMTNAQKEQDLHAAQEQLAQAEVARQHEVTQRLEAEAKARAESEARATAEQQLQQQTAQLEEQAMAVQTPPPQSPVPVKVENRSSAQSAVNTQEAMPSIAAMLRGSYSNDEGIVTRAKQFLDGLNKPSHGNRKDARKANLDGLAQLKGSDYVNAIVSFSHAVEFDPADQETWSNLAYANLQAGKLKEATNATIASLTLAPDRASSWGIYGEILARQAKQSNVGGSFFNTYISDAVGAFLNANRFSRNQDKTREYLQKLANEDSNEQVKSVALKALERLGQASQAASSR